MRECDFDPDIVLLLCVDGNWKHGILQSFCEHYPCGLGLEGLEGLGILLATSAIPFKQLIESWWTDGCTQCACLESQIHQNCCTSEAKEKVNRTPQGSNCL